MIAKISKKILAFVMAVLMIICVGGVDYVNAGYTPSNSYIYSNAVNTTAEIDNLHTNGTAPQYICVQFLQTNNVRITNTWRNDQQNPATKNGFITPDQLHWSDGDHDGWVFVFARSEENDDSIFLSAKTGITSTFNSGLKLYESQFDGTTYYAASEREYNPKKSVNLYFDNNSTTSYHTVTYKSNTVATDVPTNGVAETTIHYKTGSNIQSTSYESVLGPVPSGRVFAGWSASSNGTIIPVGSNVISNLAADTILYARFAEPEVTMKYTVNSSLGTVTRSNESVGVNYGVPNGSTAAKLATNSHSHFDGWYREGTLVTTDLALTAALIKQYSTASGSYVASTFTAQFTPNTITPVANTSNTYIYDGLPHGISATTIKDDESPQVVDANATVQYSYDGTNWYNSPTDSNITKTDPGTYTYYVRAIDNTTLANIDTTPHITETLIINKASPADDRFAAAFSDTTQFTDATNHTITYDYVSHMPSVTVKDNGITVNGDKKLLTKDVDYSLTYTDSDNGSDMTNHGVKTITITGKGTYYTGTSVTLTYEIKPRPITATNFFVSEPNELFYYDGTEHKGTLSVKDLYIMSVLTYGKDYTLTYTDSEGGTDCINHGTKSISVQPIGNYTGNPVIRTYEINPMDVSKAGNETKFIVSLADPDTHVYNGEVQYSGVKFSTAAGNKNVITSADYDITYNDQGTEGLTTLSKNVGTKVITVTPKGNYTNTGDAITRTYTVTPADIAVDDIWTVDSTTTGYIYNGRAQEQAISGLTSNKKWDTLAKDTDYTLTYTDQGSTAFTANAGTKVITITPIGNYKGTPLTQTFEVAPASFTKLSGRFTVAGLRDVVYNGEVQKETPVITDTQILDAEGNTASVVLTEGTDYQINGYYDGSKLITAITKNIGAKYIDISGKGNYTSSFASIYDVTAADSTDHFDVQTIADVTFNHESQTPAPTVLDETIKDASGNSATLVSGTDYDVTYSADTTNAGTVTVTFTAKGNYEDTPAGDFVKATYKINPLEVLQSELSLSTYTFVYNGSEQTPDLTVTDQYGYELKQGRDYTVQADSADYTNAGTKYATIVPKGNYTNAGNTLKVAYVINPKNISEDVNITVDPVVYDGSEHKQAVTVVTKEGTKLVEGTDYTVSYPDSDYENLGTKNVTVTFKGNYTGSASASYKITRTAGVSMYRLYNANSGEHFYTASADERDTLTGLGWNYEGVGWTAPKLSSTPVYRMYNDNGGEHHYTTSAAERDSLVEAGWSYEGIGWYSDDTDEVPLYRLYNPNAYANNHHYTSSEGERDYLTSIGWSYEGIGWYGM